MATNSLKLLMGDYNSDSETDEDNAKSTPAKNNNNAKATGRPHHAEPAGFITSWTQCIDKATGHPYYWHSDTKEVTWDIPAEYQTFLEQNADLLCDSNVSNLWTVCYTEGGDEEAAQRYYVNEYTRIVSWDKPIGFVEPEIVAAPQAANVGKAEVLVSKNIIKRRKVAPKPKPKRENPYSKPSEEETV